MKKSNKTIQTLKERGYQIREISYRFQGFPIKRKGYDIRKDGHLLISLEPCTFGPLAVRPDKWFIRYVDYTIKPVRGYYPKMGKWLLDLLP